MCRFMQVPQRLYSLDELKLNGIEAISLLSPVDATLGAIERNLQIAAILSGSAAWYALDLSPQQILFVSLGVLFLWTLDLVNSLDACQFVFWNSSMAVHRAIFISFLLEIS